MIPSYNISYKQYTDCVMKSMRKFAVTDRHTLINLAAGKQYFDHNWHALTYNINVQYITCICPYI